ncbi:hypothetical protein [Streptomyces sp. NBC_00038]|uniref:hypothetical protein n=1 Tax=unclassified Streptomyces TaxID=2593676 RepID=UPI002259B658|nr:hypothetical protein [Streptomyces sp. NBC_00038]MCX5557474.1 hypothetical protein [Streptomyces sp. NBC_00038]
MNTRGMTIQRDSADSRATHKRPTPLSAVNTRTTAVARSTGRLTDIAGAHSKNPHFNAGL